METRNDALLVSRVALLGDQNAFCRLVEAYQSPIRRFLLNLTGGDEELSKDLAQDTFIKAWIHIGSFRAAAKFSTWLYRIAYNLFYDHQRSRREHAAIDSKTANNPALAHKPDRDFGIDLEYALQTLREEERAAVVLFYIEDQTIGKIASILNCPTGTVKSHLHRAKEKLSTYFTH